MSDAQVILTTLWDRVSELGWPMFWIPAAFLCERLVFLRGQPHRRPVLGWFILFFVVCWSLKERFAATTAMRDWAWSDRWELSAHAVYGMWTALCAIADFFIVEIRALRHRRARDSRSESQATQADS